MGINPELALKLMLVIYLSSDPIIPFHETFYLVNKTPLTLKMPYPQIMGPQLHLGSIGFTKKVIPI